MEPIVGVAVGGHGAWSRSDEALRLPANDQALNPTVDDEEARLLAVAVLRYNCRVLANKANSDKS
jgi:hypothetical protein